MADKWTPGPWIHDVESDGIYGAEGEGFPYVMSVLNVKPEDASLIAAAPEMAALLAEMERHALCTCAGHSEWETDASVLLRRIRGEEPGA